MIIVTGAAGFIGSCLVSKLNNEGYNNLLISDDFSNEEKDKNLDSKKFSQKVHRDDLMNFIKENHNSIEFIFHIGARTDTTEFDMEIFNKLNLHYTQALWKLCVAFQIPLVYASSAATYGAGEFGYDDNEQLIPKLKPLNPYGDSKNDFDKWALLQKEQPPFWAGLKFFNVYGPNEYHKGRMASVIWHSFNQIKKSGRVKLFKSHRAEYKDGMQLRDFVYVKDVCDVCIFLIKNKPKSSIYNLGTGTARAFLDLATGTFNAMKVPVTIDWIDIPKDIRDKYQYFTEAKMEKLRSAGYTEKFYSLEEGINDYVQNYLVDMRYY
ncbi:MAG: ADP-glyceromanno-heptose 6-epimerase [Bacteroidia bacterium]